MKRSLRSATQVLSVLLLAAAVPSAQGASVAYVNAGGGSLGDLSGYGHTIDYITPGVSFSLSDLAGYDAVVVASNSQFADPASLGDVLADYADNGGGVILTEFVFQGGWALGGRIMTSDYSPFTIDPLSSNYVLQSTIGTVYEPGSSLLAGVVSYTTEYQANVGLHAGATLVADWTSGRHAIAYRGLGNSTVVGLNSFLAEGYNSGNREQLLANAIDFSTGTLGNPPVSNVPESASVHLLVLVGFGLLATVRRIRDRRS